MRKTTLTGHGGEKMKCDSCANQKICVHYTTIQYFLFDTKHGLGSLNPAIMVELVVKECPYYKKQRQPKKKEAEILSAREKLQAVLDVILHLEKEQGLAPKGEVIQHLLERRIKPEEAEKLIHYLEREGTIYEPKDGYLKKT
jgi:hypothetical protein